MCDKVIKGKFDRQQPSYSVKSVVHDIDIIRLTVYNTNCINTKKGRSANGIYVSPRSSEEMGNF